MTSGNHTDLHGKRVLVVEDEYLIADDISIRLRDLGARVVGPIATLDEATAAVCGNEIDYAVIDVDLRGQASFPLIDLLAKRAIPLLLVTGYDRHDIPACYRPLPLLNKPTMHDAVATACAQLCSR